MAVIITAPHGGKLKPSTQNNGESWPDRKNGCKGSSGECIWTYTAVVWQAQIAMPVDTATCTLQQLPKTLLMASKQLQVLDLMLYTTICTGGKWMQ